MTGNRDPTQITTFELTKPEVRIKVKAISETTMPEEWAWGKEAYRRANPAPSVSCHNDFTAIFLTIAGTLISQFYRHTFTSNLILLACLQEGTSEDAR